MIRTRPPAGGLSLVPHIDANMGIPKSAAGGNVGLGPVKKNGRPSGVFMTVVVGNGVGNLGPWAVLSGFFTFSAADSTTFTASNFYGTVVVNGSGFTYAAPNLLTGGTITGIGYALTGGGSEGWAGFSVDAVAAYNAIATQNLAAFGALFFGGADVFNYTDPGVSNNQNFDTGLYGFGGNDTFNITLTKGVIGTLDGGSGIDTLNLSGTVNTELPPPYNQVPLPNFNVRNFEFINLAAGSDYILRPNSDLVTAGNTIKIDASALGASNRLVFYTNSYTGVGPNYVAFPAGNITLLGGAGNDFFQGGFGTNIFNGGGGSDTVSFDTGQMSFSGNTGVTVNLSNTNPQSVGGPVNGLDTFISIENLIGTSRDDVLTGDAGNNVLDGGSGGADVLNGGAGDDTLINGVVMDGGAGFDTAIFSFPYFGQATYSGRTVTINGISLTNVEMAVFNGQAFQIAGPQVTTTTKRIAAGQTVALSSLVSTTDLTGDTITTYQLWDGSVDPNSGHFKVNGVDQAAGSIITITAAQFALTNFVAGSTVSDNLQIRAFDGNSWSAADNASWAPFTVGPTVNRAPVVTPQNPPPLQHGQSVALSSLISVTDADNDTITRYQLWDGNRNANSGYFLVNNQVQAAGTVIDITAAQLSQTFFVVGMFPAGATNTFDQLQVRAFDGFDWSAADNASWSPFNIGVPANSIPYVNMNNYSASRNQTIALSSILGNSSAFGDSNNDTITKYQLWDSTRDAASGNWFVNGVAQAPGTIITVTAAQIGQVSFVSGVMSDSLQVRIFDGLDWSAPDNGAWSSFSVLVPESAPQVLTVNKSSPAGRTLALSSLMTVSDADNDTITNYQLYDSSIDPNSGHFVVGGVVKAAGTVIDITAAQLAQTSFVTGSVADNLQIRAFDGALWSAADNAPWSPFTVAPSTNNPPIVSTANVTRNVNQTVALSTLATITDADNDTITRYQLWDSNGSASSGHFVVNGVNQAANKVLDITAAQFAQTSFVVGSVADNLQIRAFDGTAWSAADNASWAPFTVTPSANHAPVVNTTNSQAQRNQTVPGANLMGVGDPDFDTITKYQFLDVTTDPSSGHFVLNGVTQTAGTVLDVTAAQLPQLSFVTGTVGDTIQVRAFDGTSWSAADNDPWSPFTFTVTNAPPNVTTSNVNTSHGQTLALSSLATVSDPDGDTITKYQLGKSPNGPTSGHWVVNGVVQPEFQIIDITAAQVSQTSYVSGQIGDTLYIRAFDGNDWSVPDSGQWAPFNVIVPAYTAPVVTTANVAKARLTSYALSTLFTETDADGDPARKYQLWDGTRDPNSGHFAINGVTQSAGTVIDVTAAQLAQTTFVTGTVDDDLQIRASDGISWSAADNASWAPFHVSTNRAPVVTTSNVAALHGRVLSLSGLFQVSDADSDSITRYQLWDGTRDPASGHFVVNGVAQAPGTIIDITASQLAQTTFFTVATSDVLQIRAYDGRDWSAADTAAWAPFTVQVAPYTSPTLTTADVATTAGQTLALSSLITVSDPDGDTMTKYQLWDSTADPNSGHWVVNGAAQAAGTVINVTAAQLAQTSFLTGSGTDSLQVRAFDGLTWTAADNAAWAPFLVTPPINHAPVVTTTPKTSAGGQTLTLSSLFSVSDPDNDTITKYQLWDGTRDPNSGHFAINGQTQSAGTIIDVSAAQLAQTTFVTGTVADSLQIRAFDGALWSAADTASWAPFTVSPPANRPPVVTTSTVAALHGRVLPLSSLFQVSDPDSDPITRYQLWDGSRDPASGHFVVNGIAQSAGTVIDISASQLAQTTFFTVAVSDSLQIRAFDGKDWSAADDAAWATFTVQVAPYTSPTASTSDVATTAGQSLPLSNLITVTDPDGDTMTKYQLWDSTSDPNSGHWVVNGQAQAASTIINVTAAQLAQTSFLTGTVGDSLQIRAFDGLTWTAADNASWAPFHINVS